jgi:DNA repair ATPase RecN
MIKHSITNQNLDQANNKINALEGLCAQYRLQLDEIPNLRKDLDDLEIMNEEIQRKLDEANEQIE